ncbi:meiotic recombination protein REC8 homolog [Struthio camelus]|uniref:meiotic recombination protein REC8 homolog n=1 Tax=Struthio camelus TaxID=8801 RepID=UPI0036040D85
MVVAVGLLWITVGQRRLPWGGCGSPWGSGSCRGAVVGRLWVAVGPWWLPWGRLWVAMGQRQLPGGGCGSPWGSGGLSPEISLEVTEEELRPRLLPPEERRPPVPPVPPPVLPEVPEGPEPELPPGPPPSMAALRRLVLAELARTGGTDVASLLPPAATRSLVSRLFSLLLELCGARVLRLEQARPYGPIAVGLGPRFSPPAPR